MKRRHLLKIGAASFLLPKISWADDRHYLLRAEAVEAALLPDLKTPSWGFNGATPGPVLRVKQGDRLRVTLENALTEATTIHWHGIRIDNAMDGVPELTQDEVQPGDHFTYDFVAPDAGSFWYHSHKRSFEQLEKGLYGALIVEETTPPIVDHDIVVLLDDWRLTQNGELDTNFQNGMDISHSGRLGNFAKTLILGDINAIKKGSRIRLRVINTATDRIFPLLISGLQGEVVAFDGMPLALNQDLSTITLAPAQRVDVIGDITEDQISFLYQNQNDDFLLGEIQTHGEQSPSAQPIPQLPQNQFITPDLKNAQNVLVEMQGGMMARAPETGTVWALSNHAGLQDPPLLSAKKGESALFILKNDTAFAHAIHFHGHHLRAVERLGLGPMRDTFLVDPGETLEVVAVLDNVGKWLIHCHMLAHNAGGMMSWFEVTS